MTPQTATVAMACLYCGAPVGSASPVVKGLCEACVASVMGRATRLIRPAEQRPEPAPAKPHAQAPSARLSEALARVVATGTPAEAMGKVAELLEAEKRATSLVAFVPVIGPWRLLQSTAHSAREQRLLISLSAALTGALAAALVMLVPVTSEVATLHERVQSDARMLDGVVEGFRSQHGRSPSQEEFRESVGEAHLSIFDPWGRPYFYQPAPVTVTFGSLGKDGAPGGVEQDADDAATFPYAAPPA
jgi:hypothetical protein